MNREAQAKAGAPLAETASVFARWVLAWCFLYMGFSKAVWHDPEAFLTQVHEYGVVTNPFLLNAIAGALPWFEIICGLLLATGVAVRGTALVVLGMLAPFTLLVLRRALGIAAAKHLPLCTVKFDCGCGAGEVFICNKLAENSGLMLLAIWLLARRTGRICLRFSLWPAAQNAKLGTESTAHLQAN